MYMYLINCSKEPFYNNIYQPIKELERANDSILVPYIDKIRKEKYPKIHCYENNKNNMLVFNNSNKQNKRNQVLNKLNDNYFKITDDAINQMLLPKNNELFII